MEKKVQKRRITTKLGKAMQNAIKGDYERLMEQVRKFDDAELALAYTDKTSDYDNVRGYQQAVIKTALGIVQDMANVIACYDNDVDWNEWYVINKEKMNI
jgi:hypothetical protein